jgi:hypothetical protein
MDIQAAARSGAQRRSDFIKTEEVAVYPDTAVWIKDFNYSYNEPMHNDYFWHTAFDDYPVVGVSWKQAKPSRSGEPFTITHTEEKRVIMMCLPTGCQQRQSGNMRQEVDWSLLPIHGVGLIQKMTVVVLWQTLSL